MNDTEQNTTNKGVVTLSITQIIFIIVGLLVLYFAIVKPSIARGVCDMEAFRLAYYTPEPIRSGDYPDNVKLQLAEKSKNEHYRACKAYNAGKVWEQFIFKEMKL